MRKYNSWWLRIAQSQGALCEWLTSAHFLGVIDIRPEPYCLHVTSYTSVGLSIQPLSSLNVIYCLLCITIYQSTQLRVEYLYYTSDEMILSDYSPSWKIIAIWLYTPSLRLRSRPLTKLGLRLTLIFIKFWELVNNLIIIINLSNS